MIWHAVTAGSVEMLQYLKLKRPMILRIRMNPLRVEYRSKKRL
jgi:hypothetical protein